MVLSRMLFFRRSLTTAVFMEFGKDPENREAFDWCLTWAWRFKVLYYFFPHLVVNCFKYRHGNVFLKLRSNLSDLCITWGCANRLSDIINILRKGGSKLIVYVCSMVNFNLFILVSCDNIYYILFFSVNETTFNSWFYNTAITTLIPISYTHSI